MIANKTNQAPIFATNLLGNSIKVFPNRVEYKVFFNEHIIPINQIANVNVGLISGIFFNPHVVIETTGGKKIKMPTFKGKQLKEVIFTAMNNT